MNNKSKDVMGGQNVPKRPEEYKKKDIEVKKKPSSKKKKKQ